MIELTDAVRAVVEAAREFRSKDLADTEAGRCKSKDTFTAEYALATAVDALEQSLDALGPNEPMPWDAVETTWGEVPAGWFVKSPRADEWYEVIGTELTAAGQMVTLNVNGKVGSWPRPPKGGVTAVAGTRVLDLTKAIETFASAFEDVQVIQDPVVSDGSR